jgi:hypothetical protein
LAGDFSRNYGAPKALLSLSLSLCSFVAPLVFSARAKSAFNPVASGLVAVTAFEFLAAAAWAGFISSGFVWRREPANSGAIGISLEL